MFTFIALSNNISTPLNSTSSTFHNTSIFFAFSSNPDSITSISVNKLTIDSTTQKTRLSNATSANVEIKLKRAFNYYAKFRSIKNFSMNLLIDLTVLLNCDSIIIKTILVLLVKVFFTNFYESKLYKKAMIDAQHKIN